MTCYQACRPFEIFTICLAFLLIQTVVATAITVKSTSRELDGKSFSNCPGTFLFPRLTIVYPCSDFIQLARDFNFNSNIKLELQGNALNLKQVVVQTVKKPRYFCEIDQNLHSRRFLYIFWSRKQVKVMYSF